MIKAQSYNATIGDLIIKSVVITVDDPIRNDKPATDDPATDDPATDGPVEEK